jgi:hypothetical protein
MAVTQISRIQHRRGLEQDLPQLASAELGWSIDTRQLYIGNGTLDEGAPVVGITRILTEHDIAAITNDVNLTNYTFYGNAAGYTVQSGPSSLSPVVRTIQNKFDDVVNIRDFGATGDGVTDDTSAINRALQQIYKSTVSPTTPLARRTIYFSGGTYLVSTPILVPPYATLIGDGVSSVIIQQINGNQSVVNLCDSSFQTGASIGSGSAIKPGDVQISGIRFLNSNSSVTAPLVVINSASNVSIENSGFVSNITAPNYPNLVSILSTVSTTKNVVFDKCQFLGAGNAISAVGNPQSLKVYSSMFDNITYSGVNLHNTVGFTSIGNYYNVGQDFVLNGNNVSFAYGDTYSANNDLLSGLLIGNLKYTTSQKHTLTTTPIVFSIASNVSVSFDYEVRLNSNSRFGTFTITRDSSSLQYSDDYIETPVGVGANLYANTDSVLVSVTSGTATYQFNSKRFL